MRVSRVTLFSSIYNLTFDNNNNNNNRQTVHVNHDHVMDLTCHSSQLPLE